MILITINLLLNRYKYNKYKSTIARLHIQNKVLNNKEQCKYRQQNEDRRIKKNATVAQRLTRPP